MKTKNASPVRQLVPAALFLALAFVLPLLTGQVPKVGNMLCPMHFPVLLCGFVLGGPWGLAVGFAAPLLRSVLFGMPPMFPVAISMAFELATYGLVSGLLWRRAKHSLPALYAVLLTAMVSGRNMSQRRKPSFTSSTVRSRLIYRMRPLSGPSRCLSV